MAREELNHSPVTFKAARPKKKKAHVETRVITTGAVIPVASQPADLGHPTHAGKWVFTPQVVGDLDTHEWRLFLTKEEDEGVKVGTLHLYVLALHELNSHCTHAHTPTCSGFIVARYSAFFQQRSGPCQLCL